MHFFRDKNTTSSHSYGEREGRKEGKGREGKGREGKGGKGAKEGREEGKKKGSKGKKSDTFGEVLNIGFGNRRIHPLFESSLLRSSWRGLLPPQPSRSFLECLQR